MASGWSPGDQQSRTQSPQALWPVVQATNRWPIAAHTFCESRDGPGKSGLLTVLPAKTDIFAQFITAREKQILTRVIGIRKEN